MILDFCAPLRGLLIFRLINEVQEQDCNPNLILDETWKDVILDPAILELFFTVYWKIRMNHQLAHHARNCLVQLASLKGCVLDPSTEPTYIANYVRNFLNLLTNIEIIDQEAVGLANAIKKLVLNHTTSTFGQSELLKPFIEHVTRMTCLFCEGSAQEESVKII